MVIDGRLLIDVPPEVCAAFNRSGLQAAQLEGVVVSHLHGDHILGLGLLMLELSERPPGTELPLAGPVGIAETAHDLFRLAWRELSARDRIASARLRFDHLVAFLPFRIGQYEVTPIPVVHGATQAFGFRIDDGETRLFVSGDTVRVPAVDHEVADADISVLDVSSIEPGSATHMSVEDLGAMRQLSTAPLFAVHRGFEEEPELPGVIYPADGDTFRLTGGDTPVALPSRDSSRRWRWHVP